MARTSLLAKWHLLSLDAPTVAALWTCFLARCVGVQLPWSAPVAMFVAVWMIYAADRLLDARAIDTAAPGITVAGLEERHYFHHRHRGRYLATLAGAAVVLVCLLPRLSPQALLRYSLLATLLGAWLLIIHARDHRTGSTQRLPKELAVGLFFPAAVFVPTVSRAPWLQAQLLPGAALFAGICTLNCLFLYAWEHAGTELDPRHAHWTTLWAVRHLPQLAAVILLLSTLAAASSSPLHLAALACALSAALLLLLHLRRHNITPIHLRAAADLVLLTPLVLLPLLPR